MTYVFHPNAEAEHLEIVAYFESKRAGLGALYLAEFEKTLGRVCEAPQRYPVEKEPGIRRIRMERFPTRCFIARFQARCRYWRLPITAGAPGIGWKDFDAMARCP